MPVTYLNGFLNFTIDEALLPEESSQTTHQTGKTKKKGKKAPIIVEETKQEEMRDESHPVDPNDFRNYVVQLEDYLDKKDDSTTK